MVPQLEEVVQSCKPRPDAFIPMESLVSVVEDIV